VPLLILGGTSRFLQPLIKFFETMAYDFPHLEAGPPARLLVGDDSLYLIKGKTQNLGTFNKIEALEHGSS
jgi:hypothetical protein